MVKYFITMKLFHYREGNIDLKKEYIIILKVHTPSILNEKRED